MHIAYYILLDASITSLVFIVLASTTPSGVIGLFIVRVSKILAELLALYISFPPFDEQEMLILFTLKWFRPLLNLCSRLTR